MSEKREIKITDFKKEAGRAYACYNVAGSYRVEIYIYSAPTGNCQWFTISGLYNHCSLTKDEFWDLIDQIWDKTNWGSHKRLLFFDINIQYKKWLESVFEDKGIYVSQEYESTYASSQRLMFGTGFNPLFK